MKYEDRSEQPSRSTPKSGFFRGLDRGAFLHGLLASALVTPLVLIAAIYASFVVLELNGGAIFDLNPHDNPPMSVLEIVAYAAIFLAAVTMIIIVGIWRYRRWIHRYDGDPSKSVTYTPDDGDIDQSG